MKKLIIIFVCLFLLYSLRLLAVSAYPWPVIITQPDGTKITVIQKGDEYMHWLESIDGKMLICNNKGFVTYAMTDQSGNVVSSQIIAHNVSQRTTAETQFLSTLPQKVFYSASLINAIMKAANIQREQAFRTSSVPAGNVKILVVLMAFPDTTFTITSTAYNNLFNQQGYNTNNSEGSVHDYFTANSYGKISMSFDVYGPYTSKHPYSFYGTDTGASGTDQYPDSLVYEAMVDVHKANPSLDFSQYTGIHVVFAGHGQEFSGVKSSAIWSHEGYITPPSYSTITRYAMTSELYGNYAYSPTINTIGVVCHELTHILGAPDFYDTDYNNNGDGQYTGTGEWDLMGEGNWNYTGTNNSGTCPADINMYQKIQFGWVTPTRLDSTQQIANMPNSEQNAVAYVVRTATQNERYILENRQQLGFDAGVPGHGLLIYHAAQDVNDIFYDINITHPQKMYPVCASSTSAQPSAIVNSYGNINSAGCPFPGMSNKTSFTNLSVPAILSWNGNYNNTPITNITENATQHTVSFDYMTGIDIAPAPPVLTDTLQNHQLLLTWTKPTGWPLIADTTSEQHWDGTCSSSYLSYNTKVNIICAQQFSSSVLSSYVGKTWAAVRFFPADSSATSYNLQLYTVSGTTATNIASQPISGIKPNSWNTFFFSQPDTIAANTTYAIGVSYTSSKGYTLMMDNGPAYESNGNYGDLIFPYSTTTAPHSLTFIKVGSDANYGFDINFSVRGLINLGPPLSYNVYHNNTLIGNITSLKDTIAIPTNGTYCIKTVNAGIEGKNEACIDYVAANIDTTDTSKIYVFVVDHIVTVHGIAAGDLIQVYSPLGILYKAFTATSTQEIFTLPAGFWLVKIQKTVRKVVIP
ncbi:M6 family metalloprotease domain-containing protein [Microbacter margulisiae]|uniref:M6 family metalloprotease-like protein n=1 Tax=Microbacter margulisiae TaxID=1350067 RepID=A0A7W5H1A0_9PORP|nr:M6 family metalloprotease domain-containing protein [Microbacter margulisiae]MBB3186141.1 M6 family metalloprotease-like protein [Microbacter margulisiae]